MSESLGLQAGPGRVEVPLQPSGEAGRGGGVARDAAALQPAPQASRGGGGPGPGVELAAALQGDHGLDHVQARRKDQQDVLRGKVRYTRLDLTSDTARR